MRCAVEWLLSLWTAHPLSFDGLTIHPLVGQAFVEPAFDAMDADDDCGLVLLDLVKTGAGRARAVLANVGTEPRLMFQGDEIRHGDEVFELAAPRLLAARGRVRVELRRAAGGGAPSATIQARLHRLEQFELPPDTVGYLAMRGSVLVRMELFAGPLTCRRRWGWAVSSVLGEAPMRQRSIPGAEVPARLLRRLATICRNGAWLEEAPSVWRLQVRDGSGLVGRVILAGARPVYLDLARLDGSLRTASTEPVPARPLRAAVAMEV